jgi:DnaJ-domain-containing protein 1
VIFHPNLRAPERGGKIQLISLNLALWSVLLLLSGCHYYEEYRVLKSTADIQDEKAELLKAYRLCLEKYQDDAAKAKELCGPYTQSLREIEVKQSHQR